ncbi:PAS domain-containing sensor histidine kinase [Anaeromyxobacter sp. SG66]|uniref:sensor histidine kinase n=1 Tax=Anaeromyxobacter sp. SG66 TaxID=2925410 RepID=UPI001F569C82|nr:HAMP domain-containing sensor histidine kinase [Anaeromyxobacter sp. SG66]
MRLRFALAALLPALLSLAVMALVADRLARRALDDELSARLVVAARAAAAALPADRVARLEAGQESTRTYGHIRARLLPVARATGTRLFVVRPDRTALVDSEGRIPIGEPVPALERDRFEIAEAAAGRAMASQILFEGSDGRLYKTGYAPLADEAGNVLAVVGADGNAASFVTLRRFRRLLGTVAIAGAVLGALVAALASLSVTRPLTRLTEAARRIARGDLETPLWRRERHDEIGTLRDTLEEMRRALRARDEERETLLAGIAHEVRNPLGALDLFAGLLAEELQGGPQAPHVSRIQSELAALSKVVEEFLDYARTRPPLREPVDLRLLVAEVADLAAPLAAQRQVSVSFDGEGEAKADREQLRRAAVNLVRNAVEAAPAASEVELVARAADGEATIEIRDRGPGLAPDARASLFRPFFTTKEKGTGLGLALAKKVADAHGGTLALEEREGGGTVARLAIPAEPTATRTLTGRAHRGAGAAHG